MSKVSIPSNFKIGFLGAGQLARMSALEAFKLGIQVAVFSDRSENEPVQFMTPFSASGSFNSVDDLVAFAKGCDVITLENEFLSSEILQEVQDKSGTPIFPSPSSFALIENKFIEKETFRNAGIPVAPYKLIQSEKNLNDFINYNGFPFLLKSSKGGYDGYGNKTVRSEADAKEAFSSLGGDKGNDLVAEAFVQFTKELAVQVARNETGIEIYPVCETVQENHICTAVLSPAPVSEDIKKEAQRLSKMAVEAIDGKGIYAFEFFLTKDDELFLNESAPRPHNSGHYSIEGCITSQFENHVRAVLGLPLGSSEMKENAAVMINLLGTQNRKSEVEIEKISLSEKDSHLHMYGKVDSKKGRKMGHFTLLGDDLISTYTKAKELTSNIEI